MMPRRLWRRNGAGGAGIAAGAPRMAAAISRPEPIRHRTLMAMRWVALAGQASAAIAAWVLGARFPLAVVLAVIAAAAVVNLSSGWRRHRASPDEALTQLMLDTVQTGVLLSLSGGTGNPFALFVLAPLAIGAGVLPRPRLLALAGVTGAMILAMTVLATPLAFSADPLVRPVTAIGVGHVLALAIGGAFIASSSYRVTSELAATRDALAATQLGLAREQRLQHLGGVVAAAAHEMGTPLATIKLVASELADELADQLADRPELAEDLSLLRHSADRCRDILRSMGAAGKEDLHLHTAPLASVLDEAAAPHRGRGPEIRISDTTDGMIVARDAGLIHALRNLIQNAVDFAATRVEVQARRDRGLVTVSIHDDGPGYPPHLLDRLGEPFLTTRRGGSDSSSEGYEGMGLGLFIGRTLLERSGARVEFANDGGAVARVTWPEAALAATDRAALGRNPVIAD